ncbi:MAG: hypothetical protein EBZ48_17170 [Proteobacteria bacterium]|nr:hypothetical protein [Pseudomonadota bacterium]
MNVRLQQILTRLSHFKKGTAPTRHEVSRGSGIELTTVTRIFSLPHTRLSLTEFEQLVQYLFKEFRPFIEDSTTDEQILNQLRFELLEFQDCAKTSGSKSCPLPNGGKFTLHDLQ